MITSTILKKIIGSRNDRLLKKFRKTIKKINALEPEFEKLSDESLKAKTDEFKQRLESGQTLDDLLIEAFATVREASKRTLGMRHFDVQLIGGIILHRGMISEMRTGEGKTLVATLALYLNALSSKGAHLVTVNDYLAQRDAEEMGVIYEFLGMSTGVIVSGLEKEQRQQAYQCDITYGTNNEFGFDYLRDNMVMSQDDKSQRELNFAVIDEVDSILIDEARTPLIISGAAEESSEFYIKLKDIIPKLTLGKKGDQYTPDEGDFYLEEKNRQAFLTDEGHKNLEKLLIKAGLMTEDDNLYSPKNVTLMHYISATLRAHFIFQKDVHYVVANNQVVIIDDNTGRAMAGRRWSDGLHQAVEAKEGVDIQGENQTMATITYQNFFRLYDTLSGMTGTADTEAFEFHEIYKLEVVVVPTHKPMIRQDRPDYIYATAADKYKAIIKDIEERQKKKQPILIGTASIDTSERLSHLLSKAKIEHQVLNAKQHTKEAHIVAQAGRPGIVTIATNMAGRGTDIILGGSYQEEIKESQIEDEAEIEKIKAAWKERHQAVLDSGGLYIIGSERHESRRIDNQLRGRSGRQGDPGATRFYLSLEDTLVRIFVGDRVKSMMNRIGLKDDLAIESRMLTRAIANAQKKVENHNFDIRKNLLEYDNVTNEQRKVIYQQRNEMLLLEDFSDIMDGIQHDVLSNLVYQYMPPKSLEEQWNVTGLMDVLSGEFNLKLDLKTLLDSDEMADEETVCSAVIEAAHQQYQDKMKAADPEARSAYEKMIIISTLDNHWREHLSNMDHLRGSINLRGYAQKDPKQEYKRESFELFSKMLDTFRYEVIATLSKVQIQKPEDMEQANTAPRAKYQFHHTELDGMGNEVEESDLKASAQIKKPLPNPNQKVGRNNPCPCGSGKKYKQCHGKLS